MTRGFNCKRTVYSLFAQLFRLIYYIFIAPAVAVVNTSQGVFNIFFKTVARDRIGDDGDSLFAVRRHIRRQGDKAVAVDFLSVRAHTARAVNVGIEYYSEVGFIRLNRVTYTFHSLLVFGIGYVIREHTVRL